MRSGRWTFAFDDPTSHENDHMAYNCTWLLARGTMCSMRSNQGCIRFHATMNHKLLLALLPFAVSASRFETTPSADEIISVESTVATNVENEVVIEHQEEPDTYDQDWLNRYNMTYDQDPRIVAARRELASSNEVDENAEEYGFMFANTSELCNFMLAASGHKEGPEEDLSHIVPNPGAVAHLFDPAYMTLDAVWYNNTPTESKPEKIVVSENAVEQAREGSTSNDEIDLDDIYGFLCEVIPLRAISDVVPEPTAEEIAERQKQQIEFNTICFFKHLERQAQEQRSPEEIAEQRRRENEARIEHLYRTFGHFGRK